MHGVVSMQGTAGIAFLPDLPPDHILLLSSAGPLALVSCPHTGPLGLRIPSAHSNLSRLALLGHHMPSSILDSDLFRFSGMRICHRYLRFYVLQRIYHNFIFFMCIYHQQLLIVSIIIIWSSPAFSPWIKKQHNFIWEYKFWAWIKILHPFRARSFLTKLTFECDQLSNNSN